MNVFSSRKAVLFKSDTGLLWDQQYLGFRALLQFLRKLPECRIQSSSYAWWIDDWYIDFVYKGVQFRADTPLSDADLHYPTGLSPVVTQEFERALKDGLGVVIQPGPPPHDRKRWRI